MMQLVTDRLILRPPAARDIDPIMAFYVSERSRYAGGHVDTFGAWKKFAETLGHWDHRGYGLWAVTRKGDDTIIGLVGPYFPVGWPEPEIGWLIFDGAEGKGLASEAAKAVFADVRDRLGWTEAVHFIAPDNTRSIRMAERLGAVLDPDAALPMPGKICLVYRSVWNLT